MLVVTQGDPLSVNVMGHMTAIRNSGCARRWPTVVIGNVRSWHDQMDALDMDPVEFVHLPHGPSISLNPGLYFINVGPDRPLDGYDREMRGLVAVDALNIASQIESIQPLAVVTGPIDKKVCHDVGFDFPGQTEFFASRWQADALMVMADGDLRVGLVTGHVALAKVPELLHADRVSKSLSQFYHALKSTWGVSKPKVAVCGLNPHCSDGGMFGGEERDILEPAIARCGFDAQLVSADTVFHRRSAFDGILAIYHDQGLAPFKALAGFRGINVTCGLKHLRVSPDHGPATDRFLDPGIDPRGFEAAFHLAEDYLTREIKG